MRLGPADAIRVAGPDGEHAHMLAVSERAAAGVWYQMQAISSISIEPIDQGTGTSTIRIYSID